MSYVCSIYIIAHCTSLHIQVYSMVYMNVSQNTSTLAAIIMDIISLFNDYILSYIYICFSKVQYVQCTIACGINVRMCGGGYTPVIDDK